MKRFLIAFGALFAMTSVAFADYSFKLPVNDDNPSKPIAVPTGPEVKGCADLKMKRDGSFVKACTQKDQVRKQLKDAVTRDGGSE